MAYNVYVTQDAEEDLEHFVQYLLFEKKNPQAAENLLNDFDAIIDSLKYVAESLQLCDNPRLHDLGYRRINLYYHRYFLLYRVVDDAVFVDNIFHQLQDYEQKMR